MSNSLVTALAITAIGMTLLFLSLAFFYGLLTLMASAIPDRRPAKDPVGAPEAAVPVDDEAPLRAAAIAVAMARAEAERLSISGGPTREPPFPDRSPWWAFHHQRSQGAHPAKWRSR